MKLFYWNCSASLDALSFYKRYHPVTSQRAFPANIDCRQADRGTEGDRQRGRKHRETQRETERETETKRERESDAWVMRWRVSCSGWYWAMVWTLRSVASSSTWRLLLFRQQQYHHHHQLQQQLHLSLTASAQWLSKWQRTHFSDDADDSADDYIHT